MFKFSKHYVVERNCLPLVTQIGPYVSTSIFLNSTEIFPFSIFGIELNEISGELFL